MPNRANCVDLCARREHVGAAAQFLAAPGIDVDARDDADFTPLHSAVAACDVPMIRLLAAAPAVDVNASSVGIGTPLCHAGARHH
jgi:ankyrin repeat protein